MSVRLYVFNKFMTYAFTRFRSTIFKIQTANRHYTFATSLWKQDILNLQGSLTWMALTPLLRLLVKVHVFFTGGQIYCNDIMLDNVSIVHYFRKSCWKKTSCHWYNGSKTTLVNCNCCCHKWHTPGLYAFEGHINSSYKFLIMMNFYSHYWHTSLNVYVF